MTKTHSKRQIIEHQRIALTSELSGADTVKRLNNLNWVRHEISDTEPRTLCPDSKNHLDHTNMMNIGMAYDYILETAPTTPLSTDVIYTIHAKLCENTNLGHSGGALRHNNKLLEIRVNGERMHTPDVHEVEYLLNDIVYRFNHSRSSILTRAWDIHYELIALQPFEDFNKRTARLVMNYVLIRNGYRPIIFNRKKYKTEYIQAIAARANGNRKAYTTFMQDAMVDSQRQIRIQIQKSRI